MSGQGGPNQQSSGGQQTKPDGGEMDALLLGRLQELQVRLARYLLSTPRLGRETALPITSVVCQRAHENSRNLPVMLCHMCLISKGCCVLRYWLLTLSKLLGHLLPSSKVPT